MHVFKYIYYIQINIYSNIHIGAADAPFNYTNPADPYTYIYVYVITDVSIQFINIKLIDNALRYINIYINIHIYMCIGAADAPFNYTNPADPYKPSALVKIGMFM
jgi:hypothetical protein